MLLQKFFTNPLVVVFIESIFILSFIFTILAFSNSTIHCDSDFETLAKALINLVRSDENLSDYFMVTLSNLELLQPLVGVASNGYDIGLNQPNLFFELFFQSQELSVENIDGVYLNVFRVNNLNYTVHPDFINYTLDLFEDLFY